MKKRQVSELSVNAPTLLHRTFESIEFNKEWLSLMKLSMLNSRYAVVFGAMKRILSNQLL